MVDISDKWGFPGDGRWAHRGMLRAADTIRGDLEALGLLDRIFSAQQPYQLDGSMTHSAETPLLKVRFYPTKYSSDYHIGLVYYLKSLQITIKLDYPLINRDIAYILVTYCILECNRRWTAAGSSLL